MKNFEYYVEEEKKHLVNTYNRFPVCFEYGKGVYLYDINGNKYLDFAGGIATCALGYAHKEFNDAIKIQLDRISHSSNLFFNTKTILAAKAIKKITGMDKVFFANSGAEAIETALKTARAYGNRKGVDKHEIIAMKNSFHGRTMGALSITENHKYREPFLPLISGIKFAKYNDIQSVKECINEHTCAIILELIQGESGVYPANSEFVKEIRAICNEKDILMIVDEIQTGIGRTGKWYCYQHYGIAPDIITSAKGIGNGIPCAACAMIDEIAEKTLGPGDHGTTFGGNPLACTAISSMIKICEKYNIINKTAEIGEYLTKKFDKIVKDYENVIERRGLGLMQGLVLNVPVKKVIAKCLNNGLTIINARSHTLRFVPPLIIEKKHVDEMDYKLRKALDTTIL